MDKLNAPNNDCRDMIKSKYSVYTMFPWIPMTISRNISDCLQNIDVI